MRSRERVKSGMLGNAGMTCYVRASVSVLDTLDCLMLVQTSTR